MASNSSLVTSQLNNTSNEFNKALSNQKGSALDKDAFMLLLVTQFKYQDPLNPMEDKEFVSQLSQFSSLEQLMTMNESMTSLTEATLQQQLINTTSYIGKDVAAYGTTISVDKGKAGKYRYVLDEDVKQGSITVYNAKTGQMAYSEPLNNVAAGAHDFEWKGFTTNGAVAPDGVYRIGISCVNADGKPVLANGVVFGTVNGVLSENGVTYLQLSDGRSVALANVLQVEQKAASDKPSETPGDKPDETPGDGSGSGGGTTPGDGADSGADSSGGSGTDETLT